MSLPKRARTELSETVREPFDPASSVVERRPNSRPAPAPGPTSEPGVRPPWSVEKSAELYQVRGWGEPYYTVNAKGNV
jgi:arginine decarboxylase